MRVRFSDLSVPDGGDRVRRGEFVVEGGRFEAFGKPGALVGSGIDAEVSLEGRLVLPGAMDGHVHFDDPGFTRRENFATGTRAAAAGGVTTVVDMPCTSWRKGELAAGFDADFAVLDPDERWTVDAAALHNLNRYTPFQGWTFTGRVRETWVRGRKVFTRTGGETSFGEAGAGQFVRREATEAA